MILECLKKENAPEWDRFVESHPDGWFWQTHDWINYLADYYPNTENFSFFIRQAERIVGTCPLLYERGKFLGGGIPLPHPLGFWEDEARGIWEQHLRTLYSHYQPSTWQVRTCPLVQAGSLALPNGLRCQATEYHSRIVPLSPNMETQVKQLRKSYRSLAKRMDKSFVATMIGSAAVPWTIEHEALFDEYVRWHRQLYQPERGPGTYAKQKAWLKGEHAVLMAGRELPTAATDQNGNGLLQAQGFTAFAYFLIYKQKAYYMSGAYAGKNLGVPLMWFSLCGLANLKLEEVELGWEDYGDTEKERSIAFFKKGFGGESRAWTVMTYGR